MSTALVRTPEFTRALAYLHGGAHLFLTGHAGTGKSTLVRTFLTETDRNVMVVAPTGIAALNVGGYTIHRLFGFTPRTTVEEVATGGYRPNRFAAALRALDTLIIDEASMVRADLFDQIAHALRRFGPRPGEPFGGVQVVLVGDLLQLPPVVLPDEADFFATRYPTPYFFSADHYDHEEFATVTLTTVFRQVGDPRLTEILNAIREGVLLDQARADLNARTDRDFVPPEDEFWLTLAPTNRLVTARNRQRLERLTTPLFTSHAHEKGDLTLFEPPVDRSLEFKVGAQIMMKSNDSSDRWVNGSLGRIVHIASYSDSPEVTVEFRDGTSATVTPYTWEATRPVVVDGTLSREVIGSYTQLPFTLAWAITIHKSQGQTLDRLIVDLTGGAFDFGQVYVALSRCTALAGLVLTRDVLTKDLKTDRRVIRFLRSTLAPGSPRRMCAISVLTVGDEGRLSRPRPVEVAVAFDDGTTLSTLLNPTRDLAEARSQFGISVSDVLLAPTLQHAWSVFGPVLEGWTPVGVDIDESLGLIDFELKRLGSSVGLPVGVDLSPALVTAAEQEAGNAPTALARARAVLAAHQRLAAAGAAPGGGEPFGPYPGTDAGTAYLLTRDPDAPVPTSPLMPHLSDLMVLSCAIGEVVLRGADAATARERHPDLHTGSETLRRLVAGRLQIAVERAGRLPASTLGQIEQLDALLGSDLATTALALASAGAATAILTPGARVCFTGAAQSADGRALDRAELERSARSAGLVPVATVTKTRCDLLVTAEVGSQSGKAKKAADYGKPILSVAEFLDWLDATATA